MVDCCHADAHEPYRFVIIHHSKVIAYYNTLQVSLDTPPASAYVLRAVMKILVLGKEGSGKSALINSLLGFDRNSHNAARESDFGASSTTTVKGYVNYRDGIEVVMYDTPGLGNEPSARKVLNQVCDVTEGSVDCIICCIALSIGMRVDDSYYKIIEITTRTAVPLHGGWREHQQSGSLASPVLVPRRPRLLYSMVRISHPR